MEQGMPIGLGITPFPFFVQYRMCRIVQTSGGEANNHD
jgi:hypothetical protein